jgi:siroheme synthase (precorrin-2 oxidase/ferrochelatase)
MDAFPAFFPLRGKTVIIAGEGEGALAKARLFENSPATVWIFAGLEAFDPITHLGNHSASRGHAIFAEVVNAFKPNQAGDARKLDDITLKTHRGRWSSRKRLDG